MPAKLSQTKVAKALADATLMGDVKAAKKNGISVASIERYRADLDPMSPLAVELQKELNERDELWAAKLPDALESGIDYLTSVFKGEQDLDADAVKAVTGSIETLADINMTRKIIKERLNA